MPRDFRRFILLALAAILAPAYLTGQNTADLAGIDIPHQQFTLENGLTLLVHEDSKAPIVAVNVWYHVGSKNEKPGRTGFAHLFEHLMFNGSENFNDDYFQVLERVGATDLNGTTNEDRTNYFQNVPSSALDLALWMESDRMGHLLGAIDQKKLDEQRGVVQNEKRQYENEPYAVADELITKSVWPAGHPYSWTVIGSMEDLGAASVQDVHEWFSTYYGAANAVLVVAGDVKAAEVYEKVKKYFGDVPPGPPVPRYEAWIAKRAGVQRQSVQDRVPQARLYKVWNVPGWGTSDLTYLQMVAGVLGSGKTSRLYKRLVYDDQTATSVNAYLDAREIASLFVLEVTAKPGQELAAIERAVKEELERILESGPTERELQRIKTQQLAAFTRGIERIGGFGGKSDILAQGQVYSGDPSAYKTRLSLMAGANSTDVHQVTRDWLSDGVYVLEVHPFGDFQAAQTDPSVRTEMPKPGEPPEAEFPALVKAQLSNGLKVILAERRSVPLVNFTLLFNAGFASDQLGLPGTASLAMNMLDEGTKSKGALELSEELALLGANLGTGAGLDVASVTLSALKAKLDPSLGLMADIVLNPAFPQDEFERQKRQRLAEIQRQKSQPIQMGLHVLPRVLYGTGHAYSGPFSGTGSEDSVSKITRDNLAQFHRDWIRPNNATLVVVGDISLEELQPKLEALFAKWEPAKIPAIQVAQLPERTTSEVYLVDKPGAIQSVVFAAQLAPPTNNPDEIAISTMNTILGGSFTSRINMNLREEKHWTYGAGSFLPDARGQRPYIAYAPVQSDKTKEAMSEIKREFSEIIGSRPATADELAKVQSALTLALPGSWETMSAVGSSVVEMVNYGLPEDHFRTYPTRVRSLSLADISGAAGKVLRPEGLVWVVVGDRTKVEQSIRELGIGPVHVVDVDGSPIQ